MIHGHYREEGIKNMLKLKKHTKKYLQAKARRVKVKLLGQSGHSWKIYIGQA